MTMSEMTAAIVAWYCMKIPTASPPSGRGQDLVVESLQDVSRHVAHGGLIVHHQNQLPIAAQLLQAALLGGGDLRRRQRG